MAIIWASAREFLWRCGRNVLEAASNPGRLLLPPRTRVVIFLLSQPSARHLGLLLLILELQWQVSPIPGQARYSQMLPTSEVYNVLRSLGDKQGF